MAGSALLGVERSLTGRRWQAPEFDERLAQAHAQRLGVPELVGRLLAQRGVALEDAAGHLAPTLRALLPDPSSLKHTDAAVMRLVHAVETGETVAVFGDYDVDGAAATALIVRYLRAVGLATRIYIPDRMTEGYGPNGPAFRRLAAEGVRVVVIVDCGTTAFAPLEEARALGLDVIVIDHHAAEARLPPALAIVNPNRLDESGRLRQLAACGVAFIVLVGLNRALRQAGRFQGRAEPDLLGLLDLVAVGTVADVVPLTGLNRAYVAQGLKVLATRTNPGLAALADSAAINGRLDAYHLGFALGPRINAGGRIGRADLGARLLATDDPAEARELAALLDGHNQDRKRIEAAVQEAAAAAIEATAAPDEPVLIAAGEGWHPGVVGIVAGRLKDRYRRPVCVLVIESGVAKGSARSVGGIDLGALVIDARTRGLLITGGGHPMAAGLSLEAARLPELHAWFRARLGPWSDGGVVPTVEIAGTLAVSGATVALAETVARLGPFGAANRIPLFALPSVRPANARVVGADHISCLVSDGNGGALRAIAFRAAGTPLGQALLATDGAPLHIAGCLERDEWNGETRVQLQIEDAARPWS